MAEKTPTVTMKALQVHSYHDVEYAVGDTYEADEGDVTTIEVQGKGCRADADDDAPTEKVHRPTAGKKK